MVERHMVGVTIERDDEDGSWVRYDDYAKLESKLHQLNESFSKVCDERDHNAKRLSEELCRLHDLGKEREVLWGIRDQLMDDYAKASSRLGEISIKLDEAKKMLGPLGLIAKILDSAQQLCAVERQLP